MDGSTRRMILAASRAFLPQCIVRRTIRKIVVAERIERPFDLKKNVLLRHAPDGHAGRLECGLDASQKAAEFGDKLVVFSQ